MDDNKGISVKATDEPVPLAEDVIAWRSFALAEHEVIEAIGKRLRAPNFDADVFVNFVATLLYALEPMEETLRSEGLL